MLLLSATPLEDDAHGFFRLLQLLRPEEFPEGMDVEARLASGVPLPPCTSSTRRVDIGGLPPRAPVAIDLPAEAGSRHADVARSGANAGADATRSRGGRALDRIRRALASGAALKAVLGPDETELRQQAEAMDRTDPRLEWLLTQAKRWRRANEKTLVFVAHRETLEMLRDALSARAQLATGVFHEELSAARRDTEVARFRADDGPSLLVSTEAGGEGRNFEFCHRLVLYDLPWKPSTVEQRIGRLDRIGRRIPVEIVYFRPASGIGADVVRLFERLGLFREPMAGLEPQLAHVEGALEERRARSGRVAVRCADRAAHRRRAGGAHADPRGGVSAAASRSLSRRAGTVDSRPRPGGPRRADGTGRRQRRVAAWLPRRAGARRGAPTPSSSATRRSSTACPACRAARRSSARSIASTRSRTRRIDFFASGHPLVEGLLAHFEEDPKGRVARLEVQHPRPAPASGSSPSTRTVREFEVVAFDADGRARPDWAEAFRRRSLRCGEDEDRRRRRARLARARDASRAAARDPPPACDRGGGGPQ